MSKDANKNLIVALILLLTSMVFAGFALFAGLLGCGESVVGIHLGCMLLDIGIYLYWRFTMATKAQLKAQAKYDKSNTKQVILKLNLINDADIIEKLNFESNKQGYIKKLVRCDMKNSSDILTLDSIKFLLMPIVKKYKIKSLSIFGSYARNEASGTSDVDILIDGGNYSGLIEYENMIDLMKKALGKDVDVVTQSVLDRSKSKADFILKSNIEREKVVLV